MISNFFQHEFPTTADMGMTSFDIEDTTSEETTHDMGMPTPFSTEMANDVEMTENDMDDTILDETTPEMVEMSTVMGKKTPNMINAIRKAEEVIERLLNISATSTRSQGHIEPVKSLHDKKY